MRCPKCKVGTLRKPTEKEQRASLMVNYSQATHVCPKCKRMWIIRELKVPKSYHNVVEKYFPQKDMSRFMK